MLRLTIGWHFLYQGLAKLEDPDFSSAGFLSQAKGPLGDKYRELILDDPDARQAFSAEGRKQFTDRIDRYLKKFEEFYVPSQEQLAAAEAAAKVRKAEVEAFFKENDKDIQEYLHDLERLDAAKREAAVMQPGPLPALRRNMPFEQKRIWDKQTELQGKRRAWLSELDRVYAGFREDLDSLLDRDQRARGAPPPEPRSRLQWVDLSVSWGVTAIGACLLAGLFTRLAGFAGGLFLLSIVLAQPDWPGLYPPPHPSLGRSLFVNKEFVEMMALFFLATTHVGRWGGVDFFVHHLIIRPLRGKR